MASAQHAPAMDDGADEAPLHHVVRALRRRWWLPLIAAAVAGGCALVVAKHVQGRQASAARYNGQAALLVQEDPLIYHTNAPLVKSYDPAWVPEQIAMLAGLRARGIVARSAGITRAELSDALSVHYAGEDIFAVSLSNLPGTAAQRALSGEINTIRLLRREQIRRAATFDIKRLRRSIARLDAQLAKAQPTSAATAKLSREAATLRGELAVDQTLLSVDPSGVTVQSSALTPLSTIVSPSKVAVAGLLVGLALGCLAALVAGGGQGRRRLDQT